jgi:hypothetical protein
LNTLHKEQSEAGKQVVKALSEYSNFLRPFVPKKMQPEFGKWSRVLPRGISAASASHDPIEIAQILAGFEERHQKMTNCLPESLLGGNLRDDAKSQLTKHIDELGKSIHEFEVRCAKTIFVDRNRRIPDWIDDPEEGIETLGEFWTKMADSHGQSNAKV